jgi:branched-subunit amino acid aminotransferase/4-amino-4-deoxychorismate lyase
MIHPSDYGFARGMAVFEFARVYNGVVFRLRDHLDRFVAGTQSLGITNPYSIAELENAIAHMIPRNKFTQSAIRFYLTMGRCGKPGMIGIADAGDFAPEMMIIEDEVHPLHPEAPKGLPLYQAGIALKTMPFMRDIPDAKTTNYMRGFRAVREWAAQGWHDVLFTHPDGYVTEATTSNFFCVIDGILATPGRDMLNGITRQVLLELAPGCGIKTALRDITPADIAQSTEAFITGSFVELLPAKKIDGHILPTTFDGPVFAKLRHAFTHYVEYYKGQ